MHSTFENKAEKGGYEGMQQLPPISKTRFLLEVGLAANSCAPGESEPRETRKETGEAGFPQTTGYAAPNTCCTSEGNDGNLEISP